MQIFHWKEIQKLFENKHQLFADEDFSSGISVGSFDGIHLGHSLLIKNLKKSADKSGLKTGIVTFSRPLPSLKFSSTYKGDITTLQQRLQIFDKNGIDFVILVDFSDSFASLSGDVFFEILKKVCNLKYLVEGVDFRCGYKGAFDAASIKSWCENNKVAVDFIKPVIYKSESEGEIRISSSYIRSKIADGDFFTVNQLLDRCYELELPVENSVQILPRDGFYTVFLLDKNSKSEEQSMIQIENQKLILNLSKRNIDCLRFIK